MSKINVSVKWGKQKYDNVELDLAEPPSTFKAQIFALTGVEPERQKVMVKGGMLKDDDSWSKFDIKEGHTFMVMGTAGALPSAPVAKTNFVEDMTDVELAKAAKVPLGLVNLGNTCYMNATLQCLRVVPEFQTALTQYPGKINPTDPVNNITAALRDLYRSLDVNGDSVSPTGFLVILRTLFPNFAETGHGGVPLQQDAQECWSQLLKTLSQKLPAVGDSSSASSFVDQYFGGRYLSTLKNTESAEEPAEQSVDSFLQLSCHISQEVNYLSFGLKNSLEEKIVKQSPSLGRDATYLKTSRISRLPAYLTINLVRFSWKGSVSAKVLRNVKFSITLDVYDLCTPELQEKLKPTREKFKEYEDALALSDASKKGKNVAPKDTSNDKAIEYLPYSFPDDVGSSNSGLYELKAVLSHKGRSSDSGHYVGWVHQSGDMWLKYDDDYVSAVTAEDVLKLSGGGDWHMAYMLLYGPKLLPKELPKPSV